MSTDSIWNKEASLVYCIHSWLTVSCLDNIHFWPQIKPSMSRLWRYYWGRLQRYNWKKDTATTLMCILEYNQICSNCSIHTEPLQKCTFPFWFSECHYYFLRFELTKVTVTMCIVVKHIPTLRSSICWSCWQSFLLIIGLYCLRNCVRKRDLTNFS